MSDLPNSKIEIINERKISSEKSKNVQNNLEKDNNKKKLEHIIEYNNIKSNMSIKQSSVRKGKKKSSVLDMKSMKKNGGDAENNKNENNIQSPNEEKYLKTIEDLEKKIKEINEFYSKRLENLNSDIKEKDNCISSLSNSNNLLRNSLELLTLRVDKILYNSRNNNALNNSSNKLMHSKSATDVSLEYQLKIKEKEIKNQQKLIKILKTDNKNIKSTIERYNFVDLNINLSDQLHEKDIEISNLQKKLHNCELKLEEHNLCSEKIKTLNEQILVYKKEIELQKINVKKSNKIYTELKTKIDKYGISGARLKYINNKNRKNSDDFSDINMHTLRNNNYNSVFLNNENALSGNKTDRLEARKVNYYYNKNNTKLSPIRKNKNETKINKEGLIALFDLEELMVIKKLFDDNEEKYLNFIKKINVIEKYISVKEKEMNQAVKILENKLKKNNDLLTEAKITIKTKEKQILNLNLEIKGLYEIKLVLIQKIKELNNFLNKEKNNNQILKDENSKIKNSIFNIDGIIGEDIIKEKDIMKLKKERNKLNSSHKTNNSPKNDNSPKNNNSPKSNKYNNNNNDIDKKIVDSNKEKEGYRTGPYIKIEENNIIGKNIYNSIP